MIELPDGVPIQSGSGVIRPVPADLLSPLDRVRHTSDEYDLRNLPGMSAVSHEAAERGVAGGQPLAGRDQAAQIRPGPCAVQ